MRINLFLMLCVVLLAAGCTTPVAKTDRVKVTGVAQGDVLKLRFGPSLNYKVKLGLPEGSELLRRDCVTELGQRWCKVALTEAPTVTGYVSADYIEEL